MPLKFVMGGVPYVIDPDADVLRPSRRIKDYRDQRTPPRMFTCEECGRRRTGYPREQDDANEMKFCCAQCANKYRNSN